MRGVKRQRVEALRPASRSIHLLMSVLMFVPLLLIKLLVPGTFLFYVYVVCNALYVAAFYVTRVYADEKGLILVWGFWIKRVAWSEISGATCFRTRGVYSEYLETGVLLERHKGRPIVLPASRVQVRILKAGAIASSTVYLWQEDLARFINAGGRGPFNRRVPAEGVAADVASFKLRRGWMFWWLGFTAGLIVAVFGVWTLMYAVVLNDQAPRALATVVEHQPKVIGENGEGEHWHLSFVTGSRTVEAQADWLPSSVGVGDRVSIKYAAIDPAVVIVLGSGTQIDPNAFWDYVSASFVLFIAAILMLLSQLGVQLSGYAIKPCLFERYWRRKD